MFFNFWRKYKKSLCQSIYYDKDLNVTNTRPLLLGSNSKNLILIAGGSNEYS